MRKERWGRGRQLGTATAALTLSAGLALGVPAAGAATSPVAQIRANWTAFFASKTPPARKIALLQDGAKFAAVIRAQAKNPLNHGVTAKVLSVKMRTKTRAAVRYTIFIARAPALKNQGGTAILQGKTWKVGDGSFCALLALQGTKPAACPKAA